MQCPRNQFAAQVHLSWGRLWAASSCQLRRSSADPPPLRRTALATCRQTPLTWDEAAGLNISQPVSLAKRVNQLPACPKTLPMTLFGPDHMAPYRRFISSPTSRHPIPVSVAPREEEDGPSCGAQVCLSEVGSACVCVCVCLSMRVHESRRSIWKHLEQVSFHLCRSQFTFSSARVTLLYFRYRHIRPQLLRKSF